MAASPAAAQKAVFLNVFSSFSVSSSAIPFLSPRRIMRLGHLKLSVFF
jgi:hypothetical protein